MILLSGSDYLGSDSLDQGSAKLSCKRFYRPHIPVAAIQHYCCEVTEAVNNRLISRHGCVSVKPYSCKPAVDWIEPTGQSFLSPGLVG
jgi:hypothetical protein